MNKKEVYTALGLIIFIAVLTGLSTFLFTRKKPTVQPNTSSPSYSTLHYTEDIMEGDTIIDPIELNTKGDVISLLNQEQDIITGNRPLPLLPLEPGNITAVRSLKRQNEIIGNLYKKSNNEYIETDETERDTTRFFKGIRE